MKNKEEEYREIFLAEALEQIEELNRLMTQFEKNQADKNAVHALFRITHTLKGNAAGMGFSAIGELAHVLEDLFGEVREGRLLLDSDNFGAVFKAVDTLGLLANAITDNSEVKYKGIKTKLEVFLKRVKGSESTSSPAEALHADVEAPAETDPALPDDDLATALTGEDAGTDTRLSFSDLVQVPVRKLDNLLNLVGELIIEKDRILAMKSGNGLQGSNEFSRLSRISSDLQYSVMDVRLVQIGFLFNKFHRVVRDAASSEKKRVHLKLIGTETEIDRNVLQVFSDSLIHLIRNAVGHGIELPDERKAQGKTAEGTIWLGARNETDAVIIDIRDDGRGLDYDRIKRKAIDKKLISAEDAAGLSEEELSLLIFEPGFSTMDQVTAISGRGVGMDVVKKTLDSIGGTIKVLSEKGQGTTIQLTLPSSMAVKSCLLFELEKEVYALPLAYTESVISLYKADVHKAGGGLVAAHLGRNIAVIFLKDILDQQGEKQPHTANPLQHSFEGIHPEQKLEIVVVSFNNRTVGLVVDRLLQQKEIVEKPLMKPVDKIRMISGVTILGSGNVCLVLNVPQILNHVFNLSMQGRSSRTITTNKDL